MEPGTLAMLANSKAGEALAKGVGEAFKDAPTSAYSVTDSRGFLDGSGWTVNTGGGAATGATGQRSADPFGASVAAQGPQQAGVGNWLMLALFGGAAFMFFKKKG